MKGKSTIELVFYFINPSVLDNLAVVCHYIDNLSAPATRE